ncbi:MAG: hypothetical protein WC876_01725 [Candidatus Thermoplasmatota archaeon]|jgi:hypothetical protein
MTTLGTIGGVLFLAWVALKVVAWVLVTTFAQDPDAAYFAALKAMQAKKARGEKPKANCFRQHGHCLHAPKCIGVGVPDERDPLGCCNCGTRENERKAT